MSGERLPDSTATWQDHKALIKQIYFGRDGQHRNLRDVRQTLISAHQFPLVPHRPSTTPKGRGCPGSINNHVQGARSNSVQQCTNFAGIRASGKSCGVEIGRRHKRRTSELPSIRMATLRLINLVIAVDDAGALRTLILHNARPLLMDAPAIVPKLLSGDACNCLEYFLSVQQPDSSMVKVVVEGAVQACAGKLRGRSGRMLSTLLAWIRTNLRGREAILTAKKCFKDAQLPGEASSDRSKTLEALVGTLVYDRSHGTVSPDHRTAPENARSIIHRLIAEAGQSYIDDVAAGCQIGRRYDPVILTIATNKKITRLRVHRTLHFPEQQEYERTVLDLLDCVAQGQGAASWTATFIGSLAALTPTAPGWVDTYQFPTATDLLIHAVWYLKHFGPQPGSISAITWLNQAGVGFGLKAIAAAVSRTDRLDTLIQIKQLGADIARHGHRALALAASNIGHETVSWLLSQGVSIDAAASTRNSTAIQETNYEPEKDLERTLLFHAYTAAHSCIPHLAVPEASRRLLSLGAKISDPTMFLMTLLDRSNNHSLEDWQLLVACISLRQSGASLEAGRILEICLRKHSWALSDYVLSRGATCRPRTLEAALEGGAPDTLMHRLLQTGRPVNQAAIKTAYRVWNLDVIKHAQAQANNKFGTAENESSDSLLRLVCNNRPTTPAETQRRNFLVRQILQSVEDLNDEDINDQDEYWGVSALSQAARNGDLELAMILLDHADRFNIADALSYDPEVSYPLDLAVCGGHLDMVQLLLNVGAKSSFPGKTGFDGAMAYAKASKEDVILELIQRFAGMEGTA
ncbi:uncharacterized protein B0I36DRAFT_395245 [Microdochium trichocladiopsis]|uniref:Ankyrin repeat-containing domain protein n=1 Tax=Microdochium trichocladiopsis TaxID=1682393 RepID=A0A9P8XV36_9PEZI|nr:uncharacterized protein B0I36DRAFT_395245 [Microdochium trichocladiopsis]KAH7018446.1 hypothetical protein B0I36DRAFT_395245 [Microdochium trichocladiopsis]